MWKVMQLTLNSAATEQKCVCVVTSAACCFDGLVAAQVFGRNWRKLVLQVSIH